jgi:hypothetical protein
MNFFFEIVTSFGTNRGHRPTTFGHSERNDDFAPGAASSEEESPVKCTVLNPNLNSRRPDNHFSALCAIKHCEVSERSLHYLVNLSST